MKKPRNPFAVASIGRKGGPHTDKRKRRTTKKKEAQKAIEEQQDAPVRDSSASAKEE